VINDCMLYDPIQVNVMEVQTLQNGRFDKLTPPNRPDEADLSVNSSTRSFLI